MHLRGIECKDLRAVDEEVAEMQVFLEDAAVVEACKLTGEQAQELGFLLDGFGGVPELPGGGRGGYLFGQHDPAVAAAAAAQRLRSVEAAAVELSQASPFAHYVVSALEGALEELDDDGVALVGALEDGSLVAEASQHGGAENLAAAGGGLRYLDFDGEGQFGHNDR